METTLRGMRKKIRSLKSEISQLKASYSNQIKPLKEKARQLSQTPLAMGVLASRLAEKRNQRREEIIKEVERLEKELDEKLAPLEKELEKEKQNYRDNYEKLKEGDKQILENKITDIKLFLDHYKILLIIGIILIVIIILGAASSVISHNNIVNAEKNRNYYINAPDDVSYICNAKESARTLDCEEQRMEGDFSNYDTVEFEWSYNYKIEGNKFTKSIQSSINSSLYKINDFDTNNLASGFDTTVSLSLRNNLLNEIVASKTVRVHYDFNESDIQLISKWHENWVSEEAEKAAKAQREAEEKAQREAEEKAAREEAERKKAEEEATRQAEEEARKQAEKEANTHYIYKTINEGENCPSNAEYCYIDGQSSGNTKYGYGYARGKIINNTGKKLSYIQVSLGIYDSSGAKVGDCWDNLSGLNKGGVWTFEAYCTAWPSGATLKDLEISAW